MVILVIYVRVNKLNHFLDIPEKVKYCFSAVLFYM